MFDCEIDNLPTHLMVLVLHPALLFIIKLFDGSELFLSSELLSVGFEHPSNILVSSSVSKKPGLLVFGDRNSRDFQTEVDTHDVGARILLGRDLYRKLSDPFVSFFRDAEGSTFMRSKFREDVLREGSVDANTLGFSVYH